jgi:hypothetical protein
VDNSEACGVTPDALGAVAHRCHAVLKLARSAVAAPEQHLRESVNVRAAHLPQIPHLRIQANEKASTQTDGKSMRGGSVSIVFTSKIIAKRVLWHLPPQDIRLQGMR